MAWGTSKNTGTGGNITLTIQAGYSGESRSGNKVSATLHGRMGCGPNINGSWSWSLNQWAMWFPAGGTKIEAKAAHTQSGYDWYEKTKALTWDVGVADTSLTASVGFGWNAWDSTQGNTASVTIPFSAGNYTVYLSHWTWGYKNGEGNNGGKNAYHLGDTSFSVAASGTYAMNTSRAVSIPNGFYVRSEIGGSSIAGSWTIYSIPRNFNVGNHSWEMDYDPYTYSISYTMNGGTNSSSNPSSYNVLYGVTFANPSRTGYRFKNWTISGTAVTGINPGANATFSSVTDLRNKLSSRTTGNKTVVANWNANTYTVVYNGNGNTGGSTTSSSHTYGTAKNLTANGFTKTGYRFAGWATSASGSVKYSNSQSVSNLTATHGGTVNLYAKWTVNTYTVAYNANGGQGSMSNTSATYGTAFNLRSNTFTRSGFTFKGWSTNANATSATYTNGQSVNNLTATHGATVTLYAVWTLNSLPSTSLTVNEILPTSVSITPTKNGKLYYVRNLPIYYSNMPIKVMSDGSVWARVYYHDSKGGTVLWSSASEAKNTQGTDKYSRLGELGNAAFKNSANKLELMLTYPTNSASGYNRWKQTNNPCDIYTGTGQGSFVPGYEAVHIDWSGSNWGGLERNSSDANAMNYCYIDGSVGFSNWWFAIAPAEKYEGGMPGPSDIAFRQCELWARIPSVTGQSVSATANTKITLTGLLDESDWYFCTETTNSTGVAYSTTTKVTTPVDQAKIRRKVDGQWKKGKTYYKKDGVWVKAKKIYIKVNGQWKVGSNYD